MTLKRISDLDPIDIPDSESLLALANATVITNSVNLARARWTKGVDVASAAELPVTTLGNSFDVNGTTTITSIAATSVGTFIKLHFNSALTLTHNPVSLILPGGADFVTSAGDEFEFQHYAGTNDYRVTGYVLASGKAIGGISLSDDNTWTGTNTFDKQVQWNKGADIASAATLPNIPDGNYAHVTGTTTITAITTTGNVGTPIKHVFDGILILTNSAAMILPGGADITTAAGDVAEWAEDSTGNFKCTTFTKASGKAVVSGGGLVFIKTVTASAVASADFSNDLDNTFDNYLILGTNISASAASSIKMRVERSGSFMTSVNYFSHVDISLPGSTSYVGLVDNGATSFTITDFIGTSSAIVQSIAVWIYDSARAGKRKQYTWEGPAGFDAKKNSGSGYIDVSGAVTGVQFFLATGNISGTFRLYGITNS